VGYYRVERFRIGVWILVGSLGTAMSAVAELMTEGAMWRVAAKRLPLVTAAPLDIVDMACTAQMEVGTTLPGPFTQLSMSTLVKFDLKGP
jgi:hypothetical protein